MKRITFAVTAMLALGVVAGWVWVQFAHPAEWEVRTGGSIVLTEEAAGDRFSVVVVFIAIGAIASWGGLGWPASCSANSAGGSPRWSS